MIAPITPSSNKRYTRTQVACLAAYPPEWMGTTDMAPEKSRGVRPHVRGTFTRLAVSFPRTMCGRVVTFTLVTHIPIPISHLCHICHLHLHLLSNLAASVMGMVHTDEGYQMWGMTGLSCTLHRGVQ